MLHRIRHNIKDDDATFDDMTQMDETYMGGKSRNHGNGTQGRSLKEKNTYIRYGFRRSCLCTSSA